MGERDRVFPPTIVVERMRAALARGGNREVTATILPGASQGFLAVQSADGRPFRRAISEEFLSTLTEWIADQLKTRR